MVPIAIGEMCNCFPNYNFPWNSVDATLVDFFRCIFLMKYIYPRFINGMLYT